MTAIDLLRRSDETRPRASRRTDVLMTLPTPSRTWRIAGCTDGVLVP